MKPGMKHEFDHRDVLHLTALRARREASTSNTSRGSGLDPLTYSAPSLEADRAPRGFLANGIFSTPQRAVNIHEKFTNIHEYSRIFRPENSRRITKMYKTDYITGSICSVTTDLEGFRRIN